MAQRVWLLGIYFNHLVLKWEGFSRETTKVQLPDAMPCFKDLLAELQNTNHTNQPGRRDCSRKVRERPKREKKSTI